LKEAVGSVTMNFQNLFEQLNELKDEVKAVQVLRDRPPGPEPEAAQHEPPPAYDFDITMIHPYPAMVAHWRDLPELPQVHQFLNMAEVVGYVYRLVPKLQAHLSAIQAKLAENSVDIQAKVEKVLVEKMFEKFQAVIADVRTRIGELRASIEQTASRGEVNQALDDILDSVCHDHRTAVGTMKCMACGREIVQVAGAVPEEEAFRTLGAPPNSMVYQTGPTSRLSAACRERFESDIVESPRSVRLFKPLSRVGKPAKPR
jgi:hypothetical protein